MSRFRIIFLHGKNKNSKDIWYPWLREVTEKLGYGFEAPDLPETDEPILEEWLEILNDFNPATNDILIGHSRGGMAIMRYLERYDTKVHGVILVAANNPALEDSRPDSFYVDGQYDFTKIRMQANKFEVLHSTDDLWVPYEAGKLNANGLGVQIARFEGKNHFGKDQEGIVQIELPKLKNLIIKLTEGRAGTEDER